MKQLNFFDELIVDNFAGGGGTSTGIELATGRPVDIAINHDPDAILMHKTNHPHTRHYCESVWDVNPKEICAGHPVGLMWLSPDCKHFSRAKGGKPVSKNIRGLAWIAVKWAAAVKPRVIILENVPEFVTWGPLNKDGYPDPKQKGKTFNSFVNALKSHGYEVKWKELKACDFGAPTIRKRFFLIARCDGKPIVFPKATHGEGKLPYRTTAECIDWSVPCKSIFERKKPLADNTLRRIARGLDKFTIKSNKPFIVPIGYGERKGQLPRVQDISNPLSTIVSTTKQNFVKPILRPYIAAIGQTGYSENRQYDIDSPLTTVVSKNEHCLCTPHISKYYGGVTGSKADEPLSTVTAIDHNAIVTPCLKPYTMANNTGNLGKSVNSPCPTVTTGVRNFLVAPHIIKYYSGDHHKSVKEPLGTVTTMERHALIESHLCILRKNMDCKSLNEPLPTITTSGGHFAEIRTFIAKYNKDTDLGHWEKVRKLLNTYCDYKLSNDEIVLFEINKDFYFISDIGMRMLEPRELYNAQGFPKDYIIDHDYKGNKYSRTKQVARCGNAVPPPFAEALVRANLPEMCRQKISTMKELQEFI